MTSYANVSLRQNRSWPLEATREDEKVDSPPRMPSYAVGGAVDSRLRGNDGGRRPDSGLVPLSMHWHLRGIPKISRTNHGSDKRGTAVEF